MGLGKKEEKNLSIENIFMQVITAINHIIG